ncbi:MAG: hypothetical protein E6Q97_20445 [Desulfurellales bacterium]|nr:MAG: hypothetical protein E6Q97_20445 [Desulfurellales bacterium]
MTPIEDLAARVLAARAHELSFQSDASLIEHTQEIAWLLQIQKTLEEIRVLRQHHPVDHVSPIVN